MTIESSIIDLTTASSNLLSTITAIQANITSQISNAVSISQNASQIPLVVIATNLINTQTLLVGKL